MRARDKYFPLCEHDFSLETKKNNPTHLLIHTSQKKKNHLDISTVIPSFFGKKIILHIYV